jgi:hypothetical protein
MKFVSLGALLSCGFLLGCSGVGSESTNDGVLPGQARQALSTPQSFTMTNAYYADSGSSCSSRATKSIAGFEPAETGTYPVFVYLTGTTMTFNGADAQNLTQEMATRGFVAALRQRPLTTTAPTRCLARP